MEDQMEKLVSGYKELFTAPSDTKRMELEDKVAEMEWDGLFLAAPAIVEASNPTIPILLASRISTLREWEVELEKNAYVLFSDLDRGEIGIRNLYKPSKKPMKKVHEEKGRKPDAGEGYRTGVDLYLIGGSPAESLPPGDYVVSLINFDRKSNPRKVKKLGTLKPIDPVVAAEQWPWEGWSDTKTYTSDSASPAVVGNEGVAVNVSGSKADRRIAGSLLVNARPVHLIPPDPKRSAHAGIQAGIHVDLLLFNVDHPPKVVRIDVPILADSPLQVGDAMKGWFNLPFPFEPSMEERMLYAVADGSIVGPIRIMGEKP